MAPTKLPAPVLGLGEHVERHQPRVGVLAEHHQQVAGTREGVDPHHARELALGLLHVEVPGTHDHLHPPHRLRPIRQRRDRLGAAHAVHPLHPQQTAGAKDDWIDLPVGAGWGAHDDLQHAGGPGGDHTHHRGARVGGAPPRHVHRGGAHRQLAHGDALPLGKLDRDVLPHPRLREEGDVGDRDLQARHHLQGQPLDRLVELPRGDEQGPGVRAGGVQLAGVPEHRPVPLLAHRRHDPFDRVADLPVGARQGLFAQQRGHLGGSALARGAVGALGLAGLRAVS